ncbi:MAG: MFS transporter [Gammaproteobacteria bacterium]|nr:MFS transporter [Pseudomonas sp.]MDY0415720.1 MFS transporter [Pseudomonas sp.]NLO53892.1 MFS transporter [Gammaproteobacteria bacterium]
MRPVEARRTLRMLWWLQLAVAMLPVWLFPSAIYDLGAQIERVSVLFFVVALTLLFLNNRPFQRFKHAVIALGKVRDTEQEAAAWQHLMHCRLQALWYACLPAWAAALAKLLDLEMPVIVLLAVATPVLFWLYRTPRQLA